MKRRTAVLIALLALCLCVCAAAEENITANFPFLGTDAYVPYQESYSFTCKVKVPYTALQIRAQLESRDLFEADTTKVFPVTETGSGQCTVHIDPGDYAYPTLIAMNGEEIAASLQIRPVVSVVRRKSGVSLVGVPDELMTNVWFSPGISGTNWEWGFVHFSEGAHCAIGSNSTPADGSDRLVHEHEYSLAGTYPVWVNACENGEWYGTEKKMLTVTALYGAGEDHCTFSVPESVRMDEDLVITVQGQGQGASFRQFHVDISDAETGKGGYTTGASYEPVENGRIVIPMSNLHVTYNGTSFYPLEWVLWHLQNGDDVDLDALPSHLKVSVESWPGPGVTGSDYRSENFTVELLPPPIPTPTAKPTPEPTKVPTPTPAATEAPTPEPTPEYISDTAITTAAQGDAFYVPLRNPARLQLTYTVTFPMDVFVTPLEVYYPRTQDGFAEITPGSTAEIPALVKFKVYEDAMPGDYCISVSDNGTDHVYEYQIRVTGELPTVEPTATPAAPTTATVGALKYSLKGSAATVTAPKSKNAKKLTIPATIKVKGKSYKVTEIKANAFKGMKKLTTVVIGKNVKTIGKNAFYKCAKLKSITIKTTKLTAKTVGANAFKGVYKKATVKVPAKKLKAYRTLLVKKGLPKTAKVKK